MHLLALIKLNQLRSVKLGLESSAGFNSEQRDLPKSGDGGPHADFPD